MKSELISSVARALASAWREKDPTGPEQLADTLYKPVWAYLRFEDVAGALGSERP